MDTKIVGKTLKVFCLNNGKSPFIKWLSSLKDERAAAMIKSRLARIRLGNLGHTRSLGEGVQELKIDYGPGYRIYFGQIGNDLIILLCGGDKRYQNEDIKTAKKYWTQFKKEKEHANY